MPVRLPRRITACLFDMDGVLTSTAELHAAAWKQMFDEYLGKRATNNNEPFVPFDSVIDYDQYVDGRPRLDGTREFLRSRGIDLPEGKPQDPAGTETIYGLSNRKNDLVLHLIKERGVTVYPGSLRFLQEVRRRQLATAVVSSSANTSEVLRVGGLEGMFDEVVDGIVAERDHLAGKPAPDTYLAAARGLGVDPSAAAVFEDALAGVEAGRAGRFGLVVGVDRVGQSNALAAHGADIVVTDLAELIG
ncbi:MAG TPA: beta-phosphoglucomutase family hydrolase [Acidimicrobiales bacterium]